MEFIRVEDCCEILDSQRKPITESERVPGRYPYYGANGIQGTINQYIFDGKLVLVAEDGGHFGSKTKSIAYLVNGKCWVNNHAHVLRAKKGFLAEYICYSLMFYKIEGYINGATRQKLTQAALRKLIIPKRSVEYQKAIVDRLDLVRYIIEKKQNIINELDLLIKSRFVELFGDVVLNTLNWPLVKLSDIAEYRIGLTYKPEAVSSSGIAVLRSGNIKNSQLCYEDTIYVNSKVESKLLLKKHDILMCARNGSQSLVGKVALIENDISNTTYGAFMMAISSKYYVYLLEYFRSQAFRRLISVGATTTINQVTTRMLNSIVIPLPDMDTINRFALYHSQINKLKSDVQKSIDETQLLMDSLMQEYFG
ncbi:restriction endonuclease subunit S [Veillonella sp. AF36-20BH]|uniref:restriction endonuclease subunit S n=1 Tax=Veillonella sp. AF36-20BH TaxID=2293251 RepID=UPI000E76EAB4|nr:restriction endonuclease subunit S [Veillonella sp. AF36-20BH]RJU17725.1 restriction endonuclease subunit S [Veillonella sp. AF36-20BH]